VFKDSSDFDLVTGDYTGPVGYEISVVNTSVTN